MTELEAEFWGLEREQSTRIRLRRVVERMRREMLDAEGLFQVWGDEFFKKLLEDEPVPVNAVGLIHKLQTEIGELRTELTNLKTNKGLVCQWTLDDSEPTWVWKTSCRDAYTKKAGDSNVRSKGGVCPSCLRPILVVGD